MFNIFSHKPLLDDNTMEWIFDTYIWALTHFDPKIFFEDTQLVLPTNAFFPGQVASIPEMSQTIFNRVKDYAQISHWPITLVQPEHYVPPSTFLLPEQIKSRGTELQPHGVHLPVSFHPAQVNKPQDLIANLTVQTAHYVASNIDRNPPGGQQFWPQSIELLACYFGFGIMMANSAYTFRGGCGSCYNKAANREAALPESEVIFALAVFTELKGLSPKAVLPHLKPYLKSDFKHAVKDIKKYHTERIAFLKEFAGNSSAQDKLVQNS